MSEQESYSSEASTSPLTTSEKENSSVSPVERKLVKQRQFRNPPVIFMPDIHNTYWMVVRDNPNTQPELTQAKREKFTNATLELKKVLEANSVPVAPITAIDLEELTSDPVVSPDLSTGIPHFDALFTANGTQLFNVEVDNQGKINYTEDHDYNRFIKEEKKFIRDNVYKTCIGIGDKFKGNNQMPGIHPDWNLQLQKRDQVENVSAWNEYDKKIALGDATASLPHEKRPQPHKISYDVDIPHSTPTENVVDAMKTELTAAGYPDIHVLISHNKSDLADREHYFIDVIPMTKGDAIEYMRQKHAAIVFSAGDKENDLFSLKKAGGVVVGGNLEDKGHIRLKTDIEELPGFKRKHRFATFEDPITNSTQLLYLQPGIGDEKMGPETLLDAVRAAKHLESIKKNFNSQTQSEK